jgi:hypothetical protein
VILRFPPAERRNYRLDSPCSREEARKETDRLCSEEEEEGWQSREIKLKELKHEGHIALRK